MIYIYIYMSSFIHEYIQYIITSNNNISVQTFVSPPSNWNLIIPDKVTYNGVEYIVSFIGGSAFQNCNQLHSIILPNTLIDLYYTSYMFSQCQNLTNIVLGNKLVRFGSDFASGCTSLKNIIFPDSLTYINKNSFNSSGLTNIVFGSGLKQIDNQAFRNCKFSSLSFPNDRDFSFLGGFIFSNCSLLTKVTYGSRMTAFGGGMFESCTSLTSIINFGLVKSIPDVVFSNTGLKSFIIPESITALDGSRQFYNCHSLTSVSICSKITNIPFRCFNGNNLRTVIFNGDIPTIDNSLYSNFVITGDTAYYKSNANNVSNLIPFFTNIIEGDPIYIPSPQNVTVIPNFTSAIVNWSTVIIPLPEKITNYKVKFYNILTPSNFTNIDVEGNETQLIIDKLTSGNTYEFTVRAFSNFSFSDESSKVQATILYLNINAPQNITGIARGNSAIINWSEVTLPSPYIITKYQLSYYNINTPLSITTVDITGNITEKIINNLTNFETYRFYVKAFSNNFSSIESQIIQVTPYLVNSPTNISGIAGVNSVTINWSEVNLPQPHKITKYQISYYNIYTQSIINTIDVNETNTQIKITGLINNQPYGFYVKAFFNDFQSIESPEIHLTPFFLNKPENITGSSNEKNTATIKWSPVIIPSPYTLTKYLINYYNTETPFNITTIETGVTRSKSNSNEPSTEITITGLNNYQTYGFTINAVFNEYVSESSLTYFQCINCLNKECILKCDKDKWDKFKFTSVGNNPNISYKQQISIQINSTIGGRVHYGNYYLGKPIQVNYLGRTEGQPGGSGSPLRNKF
jgi:hypothetical protein